MYNSWENPKGLGEHLEISGHRTLLSYTSCSYNLRVGIFCSCQRGSKETNCWTSCFTFRCQKVNCSNWTHSETKMQGFGQCSKYLKKQIKRRKLYLRPWLQKFPTLHGQFQVWGEAGEWSSGCLPYKWLKREEGGRVYITTFLSSQKKKNHISSDPTSQFKLMELAVLLLITL